MDPRIETILRDLAMRLDADFKNPMLLLEAITHPSYVNEHPEHPTGHYQRLEFLGDAVLELIVRERLLATFPEDAEGRLTEYKTALVSGEVLGRIGQHDLALDERTILFSRGERRSEDDRSRLYIRACVVEALLGALYLDQGLGAARIFVDHFILRRMTELQTAWQDPISELQDLAQKRWGITPSYIAVERSGPDHATIHRIVCRLGAETVAEAADASKKQAKKHAARAALDTISRWEGRLAEKPGKHPRPSAGRHSGNGTGT
jgi:ribonuclease-3